MNYKLKLLIVDDFEAARKSAQQALSDLGYTVIVEACDGVEALEKIREAHKSGSSFDLVFIDWNMPQMKGIDVIKTCKADPDLKAIKFVIMTSEQESNNVLEGLRGGAIDFITKPFTAETFAVKIERALHKVKAA